MYVTTKLIILHIDFDVGAHQCLLIDGKLPENMVEDCHPLDMCPKILQHHLEIDPEWVQFLLVDIKYDNDLLSVYYTCLIPSVIENTNGQWLDMGNIEDGDIQKLVFEAGQIILSRF